MYKYHIKITVLLIFFLSLNTCSEEFIAVTPKGELLAETITDFNALLNTINNGIDKKRPPEIIPYSFEICAIEPYLINPIDKEAIKWNVDVLPETHGNAMQSLYIYNKIINEVSKISQGSVSEKNNLIGQAHALRATLYFMLINLYGLPYNILTADTNLGFPIIKEADATANNFVRASVEEVYNFIIEDLSIAIPLLPTSINQRLRMSRGAAQALLGKVYVYQGKYADAIPLFNSALAYFQTDPKIDMYNYNTSTLPGGVHALGLEYASSPSYIDDTESANNLLLLNRYILGRLNMNRILLAPEISALYDSSDFRLHHFCTRKPYPSLPTTLEFPVPGLYRKRIGRFYSNHGVRLPDVYLLRAECKARTNDFVGAITDLEFLRAHRMAPADVAIPTGLNQDDLIKFIIDERTREFAIEGELWFDLRRLWHDPLFQDKKPYTHTLYAEDGTVKEIYTLKEKRLVFRFTEDLMRDNPGLINNP